MKRKYLTLLLSLLLHVVVKAQIGINTSHPKALFHIDSKKDNGDTDNPLNIIDDVVVDANGNLGLGTISPEAKLDIRGKIKITDGTQKEGFVLVSNNEGVGSWISPFSSIRTAMDHLGEGLTIGITSLTNGQFHPTGGYLEIEPGKSIIRASFYNNIKDGFVIPFGEFIQYRYILSTSPTTVVYPDYLNAKGYGFITATSIFPGNSSTCSGYWLINNPNSTNQRLYLFVHIAATYNLVDKGLILDRLGGVFWWENIISITRITG